jgi:hypothetical protein
LEKLGTPVVYAVPDQFAHDARSAAEDNGMPSLRLAVLPAKEYYARRISASEIEPIALGAVDALVAALTIPLSDEERHPRQKKVEPAGRLRIEAESLGAALEEFNRLFLDNHWGSGLPLIPPTPERVQWMLSGIDRRREEVIGIVAPKNGVATIEKIAINAVMAGAKPEYLPVIVAAMEGFLAKDFDLLHMTTSSGSFLPAVIVNGPIAKEIGMNCGIGLLGHGWRANNTIGHALRLSLLNLGHLWPVENDMALVGRLASHTFFTFAENEAQSPWEPYHVSLGYARDESAVTVSTVGGYTSGITVLGGGAVTVWSAKSILNDMVSFVGRNRGVFGSFKRGHANPSAHPSKFIFVIHPELAGELKKLGYTREGLRSFLYEQTSVANEHLSPQEIQGIRDRIEASVAGDTLRYDLLPRERISAYEEALKPGGKAPLVVAPRDIVIVVAGGLPGYTFVMSYFRVSHETRPVRGATLTASGR